ncbi:LamG-like jellyroll fold domain-containing protein [Ferruginibacter sp.]|nr:T9SS type A sorting domain-containing protein [Ferruginibacter sp.]
MKRILLITITALSISYAIAQPTAGLVAYWPMNGNFNDAGPNALNGTNIAATATTNSLGAANAAMAFVNPFSGSPNMVNQYGTHPINSLLNFAAGASFTLSFNVYVNSPFVSAGGIYDNNLNASGYGAYFWQGFGFSQIVFNWRNASVLTTNGAIPLATWKNICCVVTPTSTSIYINGVLNATNNVIGTNVPAYPLTGRFGTFSYSGYPAPNNYNGFNGKIDECRIYNRALTLVEIQQISALLPVKLTSFTATKNNTDVVLNWQTEYEQNSSHFNIQRSTDGINFTSISTTPSKGNSSVPTNYQFTDNSVKNLANVKTVFYRLQMVDIDASKVNSGTVPVKLDTDKRELTILQNPTANDLRILFSSSAKEIAQIIITDNSGRQLLTKQIQLNIGTVSTVIPVNSLAAGNYYITVTSTQGKQTKAFLKQ